MRIVFDARTLRVVSGSLTRRQLLIRTGGASVALACFGALPMGAVADSAALSPARAATYAALLDAIDADPAYALGRHDRARGRIRRALRERRVPALLRRRRARRDRRPAFSDACRPTPPTTNSRAGARALKPDALALVALAFEPSADTHTIVFTV